MSVVDVGDGATGQDINERGEVVGGGGFVDGASHAFHWDGEKMHDLGTLGGRQSNALAINDRGEIVGYAEVDDTTTTHAVRWKDGVIQDLGTLGGDYSSASDINERGQIVGSSQTASGDMHAFLWEDGVMTDLGTIGGASSFARRINEDGVVVGNTVASLGAGPQRLFRWSEGSMTDLGATSVSGLDLNERGEIVYTSGNRAFMWRSGTTTEIVPRSPSTT